MKVVGVDKDEDFEEGSSTYIPAEILRDKLPTTFSTNSAASVAMALGHKLRMQILCKLIPAGEGGLSAGTLSTQLKVVPSSLSFHLQQMTGAGVLTARHDGRSIFYSVNRTAVAALRDFLADLTAAAQR
jgi:DNA-binding transcriptional ArsR family regulator